MTGEPAQDPSLRAIRWILVGLGLATVVVRLALATGVPPIDYPDTASYRYRAETFLRGEGPPGDLIRPPVYPFVIAASTAIGAGARGVLVLQHLLGLVLLGCTYRTARLIGLGPLLSASAAILVAYDTLLLGYAQVVLPETLLVVLVQAALWALLEGTERDRGWAFPACGLAIGLAVLCKPVAQLFVVVALVFAAFRLRGRPAAVLVRRLAGLAIPAVGLVGAWMLVNGAVHGQARLTSFLGINIILRAEAFVDFDAPTHQPVRGVYGRHYEGTWDGERYLGHAEWAAISELENQHGLSIHRINDDLLAISREAIIAHPFRYLAGVLGALGRMFLYNISPLLHADYSGLGLPAIDVPGRALLDEGRYGTLATKMALHHANKPLLPLLILGLVTISGAALRARDVTPAFLLVVTIAYFALVTVAVEQGLSRYRIPFQPAVAIVSVIALRDAAAWRRGREAAGQEP